MMLLVAQVTGDRDSGLVLIVIGLLAVAVGALALGAIYFWVTGRNAEMRFNAQRSTNQRPDEVATQAVNPAGFDFRPAVSADSAVFPPVSSAASAQAPSEPIDLMPSGGGLFDSQPRHAPLPEPEPELEPQPATMERRPAETARRDSLSVELPRTESSNADSSNPESAEVELSNPAAHAPAPLFGAEAAQTTLFETAAEQPGQERVDFSGGPFFEDGSPAPIGGGLLPRPVVTNALPPIEAYEFAVPPTTDSDQAPAPSPAPDQDPLPFELAQPSGPADGDDGSPVELPPIDLPIGGSPGRLASAASVDPDTDLSDPDSIANGAEGERPERAAHEPRVTRLDGVPLPDDIPLSPTVSNEPTTEIPHW